MKQSNRGVRRFVEPGRATIVVVLLAALLSVASTADAKPPRNSPLAAEADLSATITGPESAWVDETSTYVLTASNAGPSTASAVDIVFGHLRDVTLVAIRPADAACTPVSYPWKENIGQLCRTDAMPSGSSVRFEFDVQPSNAGVMTVTGSATSYVPDPVPANGSTRHSTLMRWRPTDVGLELVVVPAGAGVFNATAVATNHGDFPAHDVWVGATGALGWGAEMAPTCVGCSMGLIPPGQSRVASLVFVVGVPPMTEDRSRLSSFWVSAAVHHAEDDPVPANDRDDGAAATPTNSRCPLGSLSCPY